MLCSAPGSHAPMTSRKGRMSWLPAGPVHAKTQRGSAPTDSPPPRSLVSYRLHKRLGVRASVGAVTCRTVVSGRLDKLVMVLSDLRLANPDSNGFSSGPMATVKQAPPPARRAAPRVPAPSQRRRPMQVELLFDPWTLPSLCVEVPTPPARPARAAAAR
jgi:hypothetical protein